MLTFRSLIRGLCLFLLCSAVVSCGPERAAEFWRPISEPNLQMPPEKAQVKLEFDISQCRCGIFPSNVPQSQLIEFQPDQQRYVQTSVLFGSGKSGQCMIRPSMVVQECMRARGWEVTQCSGRIPVPGASAMCAATMF